MNKYKIIKYFDDFKISHHINTALMANYILYYIKKPAVRLIK